VELELFDCKKLQKLPAVWQLPALKVLHLCKLPSFETWWDKREVRGENPVLPLLEKLLVKQCKSLISLPMAPLIIESSGGIDTVWCSAFPALREMELRGLEMFQQWEANEANVEENVVFPQLEKLLIGDCKSLAALRKRQILSHHLEGWRLGAALHFQH